MQAEVKLSKRIVDLEEWHQLGVGTQLEAGVEVKVLAGG